MIRNKIRIIETALFIRKARVRDSSLKPQNIPNHAVMLKKLLALGFSYILVSQQFSQRANRVFNLLPLLFHISSLMNILRSIQHLSSGCIQVTHRLHAPSAQGRVLGVGADVGEEAPAAFAFGVGADFDGGGEGGAS